ncbi:MAG: cob(I)yrinic acid a,c-diamide adenosyltransferase [Nitrospirota bacterium]|nr:cob(I)yrinic acid a,c-diamide adenosyltransferase [Nitrospirota bacterium]
MRRKGFIQIYTGDGKGKTTAAVGLAVRARGHDLKVCYVYFHKDPEKWEYGEHRVLEKLGVDVFGFAKKHPHFYKNIDPDDIRKECLIGIEFIKKIYQEKKYHILILDEINISLRDGFLKEEEVFEILDSKPEDLELILTVRGAPEKIIKMADLVSEIKNIKHPFDKGIKGREGIEY